jgi:putative FmdB family regulatory protein
MPIYEYTCTACEEIFALLRQAGDEEEVVCPKCGSKDVKKLVSSFSCSSSGESGSSGGFSGFSGGG